MKLGDRFRARFRGRRMAITVQLMELAGDRARLWKTGMQHKRDAEWFFLSEFVVVGVDGAVVEAP